MEHRVPKKKRLHMLWLYPITMGVCVVGVVVFALLYRGGGAMELLGNAGHIEADDRAVDPSADPPQDEPIVTPDPDALKLETTPVPTEPASLEGRLIPFKFGGLWGYKNTKGLEVLEPRYLRALEFGTGLFAFAGIELNGQLRYGLLTRSGSWGVEPTWSNVRPFSEGLAAVEMDEKWGYIDETGKLVIPCSYREARDFHNGRAAVRLNSNFGYIDPDGDLAVRTSFSAAGDFCNDMAFVEQDGNHYLIDKIGQKIVSWDQERGETYSEGFAVIANNGSYSYYDTARKRRFVGFEGARPFSESRAAVKQDGKWGYINDNGAMVVQPQYAEAREYSQNRAAVKNEEGKWGFIDKANVLQVPCLYDEVDSFLSDYAIVHLNNEVGLVDLFGNYVSLY